MIYHLTDEQIGAAFNDWLEAFIENPDEFSTIQEDIAKSITEASNGEVPSYGSRCAATLIHYIDTPED